MEEKEPINLNLKECEYLLIKDINKAEIVKNEPKQSLINNEFDLNNLKLKNRLCFFNLTDNSFVNCNSFPSKNFNNYYKKIANSGVGLIVIGGFFAGLKNLSKKQNYLKLDYNIEEFNFYQNFCKEMHSYGVKIFSKINFIYGRGDNLNKKFGLFNRSVSSHHSIFNANNYCLKVLDKSCKKIIDEASKIASFSLSTGFDGLVIDGTLFSILGEFSSPELNKREFGYFSEIIDFSKEFLIKIKNFAGKSNIIFELSLKTFAEIIYGKNFKKIKTLKTFNFYYEEGEIFEFLQTLVSFGVDGFMFKFGTFETEFLSAFNEYQGTNIFYDFYKKIEDYFDKNQIVNKFGNKVIFVYHDNFNSLEDLNCEYDNTLFDITKFIFANENYLIDISNSKFTKSCIKCSICDKKCRENNTLLCAINPQITYNDVDTITKSKNIAVVGSGTSGLVASLELAKLGHSIDLFESENVINPHGKASEIFGFNKRILNYNEYLVDSVKKEKKINLILKHKFSVESDEFTKYDAIIVATGFKEKYLKISGAALKNVKTLYDALESYEEFNNKNNIVINAKSELAFSLSLYLLLKGKKVSIVLDNFEFLTEMSNDKLTYFLYALEKLSAKVFVQAKVNRIESDFVELIINNKILKENFVSVIMNLKSKIKYKYEAKAKSIDCDLFIYEPETYSNNRLFYDLVKNNYGGKLYMIGEALQKSTLDDDIKSAFFVAKNI